MSRTLGVEQDFQPRLKLRDSISRLQLFNAQCLSPPWSLQMGGPGGSVLRNALGGRATSALSHNSQTLPIRSVVAFISADTGPRLQ